jgi:hypothetical protein
VRSDADGTECIGGAMVGPEELRGCGGYGHSGIIVARISRSTNGYAQLRSRIAECVSSKRVSSEMGLFQNGKG